MRFAIIVGALLWAGAACAQGAASPGTNGSGGTPGLTSLTGDVTAGPGIGAQAATIINVANAILILDSYSTAHNGTTDDTAHIQSALNACLVYGGGTVLAGPYRYLINSADVYVWGNCTLSGPPDFLPWNYQKYVSFAATPYTFLINPADSLVLESGGTVSNLTVLNSTWTAPTNGRTALNGVEAFSGTAIEVAGANTTVKNIQCIGFTTCYNNEGNPSIFVRGMENDCGSTTVTPTNACFIVTNTTQASWITDVYFESYSTVQGTPDGAGHKGTSYSGPIVGAINNGGNLELEISGGLSDTYTTLPLQAGDVLWANTGNQPWQSNGKWTVASMDTASCPGGDVCPVLPTPYTPPTFTGNLTSGQAMISNVSSFSGIERCEPLAGTGVQGGAVVMSYSSFDDTITMGTGCGITATPVTATASGTAVTVTPSPGAYTGGGTASVEIDWREGMAAYFDNDGVIYANNTFVGAHTIGYDVADSSALNFFGCHFDANDGQYSSPSGIIGIEITGAGSGATFTGCHDVGAGTAVLFNASPVGPTPLGVVFQGGIFKANSDTGYNNTFDFVQGYNVVSDATVNSHGFVYVAPTVNSVSLQNSPLVTQYLMDGSSAAALVSLDGYTRSTMRGWLNDPNEVGTCQFLTVNLPGDLVTTSNTTGGCADSGIAATSVVTPSGFATLINKTINSSTIGTSSTIMLRNTTVLGAGACSSGIEGTTVEFTDLLSPTFSGTATGGGGVHSIGHCNGTHWVTP